MRNDLDYLSHLGRESARFAEAVQLARPDAPVPTCPEWNADDLLWHLAEVQFFWATIVADGLSGEDAEKRKPERPADRDGLLGFYQRASRALAEALAAADPDAHAWTWSDDQTVGFIQRRQAHEALIHRVDAELAAGDRTPLDPRLAADGADEALRVMYGGLPDWGSFTPEAGRTVRLRATDTGESWLVTPGRFTGTDPGDGARFDDEPCLADAETDPGGPAAAEVSGTAADLDCWLWHRPPLGLVERSGDAAAVRALDQVLRPGIN
jgi:uncharacterized protein (TIGR03083 family)